MLPDEKRIALDVQTALAEDIGSGDVTAALIPADAQARATVVSRERAVLCGQAWFDEVFRQLDASIVVDWHVAEGERVAADTVLCTLTGAARPILSGERTALNFLQTLSATATSTREFVDLITGAKAKILDTRKTLPGLRAAQKYAVRCGGGYNHRFGLFDAVLIKENHIAAAGSITAALRQAQQQTQDLLIEVEVEDLAQLDEALTAGARRILLDNFSAEQLRQAVELTAGRAELEASGGVNLDTIRTIAACGVDYISVGAVTKDVRAVDLSMRFALDSP